MSMKSPATHATRPTGAHFSPRRREVPRSPVILVVTDDSLLRWAVYEALAAAHFRILACRDEAHAREILPKVEVDLSLAIVDADIWPITARAREFLRERWPHLPILVLSHPVEGLEDRLADLDIDGLLTKPFDVPMLVETVTDMVAADQSSSALGRLTMSDTHTRRGGCTRG